MRLFNGPIIVNLVGHPMELIIIDLDDNDHPRIARQWWRSFASRDIVQWAVGELGGARPGPIIVSCGPRSESVGFVVATDGLMPFPRLIMVADHPAPGHEVGMYCFDSREQMGTNHLGRPLYRYDAKLDAYRRT